MNAYSMDLEGLRSMGVDYTIIDRESADNYNLYEEICLEQGGKPGPLKSNVHTDEKRLLKLEINRIRMAERRANETNEERALRLYKNKMRNKVRRATETPEQRAVRNRRNMERNRQRRNKQREQQTETMPSQVPLSLIDKEADLRRSRYYINDLVRVELSPDPNSEPHSIRNIISDVGNR